MTVFVVTYKEKQAHLEQQSAIKFCCRLNKSALETSSLLQEVLDEEVTP